MSQGDPILPADNSLSTRMQSDKNAAGGDSHATGLDSTFEDLNRQQTGPRGSANA